MPSRPALVIGAMCLAEILSMAGVGSFAALIPALAHDWHMSASAVGWVAGSYWAGTALGTLVLPAATDRVDTRLIYFGSLALGAVGLLGFALLAHGPLAAAAARCVQGVSLAGTYFPGLRALLRATPATQHPRATACYTSLYAVGTSASFLLSGVLDGAFGHRVAIGLLAIGPALAAPPAAFALRALSRPAPAAATPLLAFGPVLRDRRVLGHVAAYAALCGQILVLQSWLVPLLARSAPGGAPSGIVAAIILLAVPSGMLGNEAAQRHGRVRMIVATMLGSLLLFVPVFAAVGGALWPVAALAALAYLAVTLNSASITNGVRATCPPAVLGRALSLYAFAGALAGVAAPAAFGILLDATGGAARPAAWLYAALMLAAVLACGPLALLRAARPAAQ